MVVADDYRTQHRTALDRATLYVARLAAADLGRQTPCTEWNLGELLAHMVGQHVGFARVVRDGQAPQHAYDPVACTTTSWTASVTELVDAFAAADLNTRVVEIELDPVRPLPIAFLVAAQYLDTVVHTWDVAATLGELYSPPDDVAETIWQMANRIPDDDRRQQPGAAFARGTQTDGSSWHRGLAALGRDPFWPTSPR